MVWVVFLNHGSTMSWNMMARMIGGANPATMRSIEISTELRITRRMSGSEKISRKFCSPTQGLLAIPGPA